MGAYTTKKLVRFVCKQDLCRSWFVARIANGSTYRGRAERLSLSITDASGDGYSLILTISVSEEKGGKTMRDIDEPIRIRCENCVYYGKECHGEYCVLIEMLSGERKDDGKN